MAVKVKQESTSEAVITSATESKPYIVYTLTKPQWLGAVDKKRNEKAPGSSEVEEEANEFIQLSYLPADIAAEDAVALLLRHFRGVQAMDNEVMHTGEGSGYHQKDRKPSQNDKTEHGMEKTVQNQGQSPKMSKSESILKNQQSNRSRN
ncbi:hypothetical protein Tco_0303786 [Tanacetum coccineum]